MDSKSLKDKHRRVRDAQPDALRIRVHRAISWLKRAEAEADEQPPRGGVARVDPRGHPVRVQLVERPLHELTGERCPQAAALRAEGCDLMQGFHFDRPLAAADFARRLAGPTPPASPAAAGAAPTTAGRP